MRVTVAEHIYTTYIIDLPALLAWDDSVNTSSHEALADHIEGDLDHFGGADKLPYLIRADEEGEREVYEIDMEHRAEADPSCRNCEGNGKWRTYSDRHANNENWRACHCLRAVDPARTRGSDA